MSRFRNRVCWQARILLFLSLALPLVGGRAVYHCAQSGRDSFSHCCQPAHEAPGSGATAGSCCSGESSSQESSGTRPCCEIRIFEIQSAGLSLDPRGDGPHDPGLDCTPDLVAEIHTLPSSDGFEREVVPPPAAGPPLYIRHASFLI